MSRYEYWNRTRYPMFFYKKFNTGSWYLGMKSDGDTTVATIGLPYRSKDELFADLNNQYQLRCAPLLPTSEEIYKKQRDVLRSLLEGALNCAPEFMKMPMGEKILIALNALHENDKVEIFRQ
jgi:hypothetical protein